MNRRGHEAKPWIGFSPCAGVNNVNRALEELLRLVVQNAAREGAVIIERVWAEKNENVGFNWWRQAGRGVHQ